MMKNKTRGFTLIELMIVVAILAIVAAIGYPSYLEQVKKSRRAEGMGHLLELADRMERFYSDKGTYAGATLGTTSGNVFVATTEGGHYTLSIGAQDNVAFTISAAPTSKGKQNKDKCGTFTMTSLGVKSVSGGSLSKDDCWK